jgi:hypothetical protein
VKVLEDETVQISETYGGWFGRLSNGVDGMKNVPYASSWTWNRWSNLSKQADRGTWKLVPIR